MDVVGQSDIQDRPDIIARIFHIKVHAFITFLKEDKTFGEVDACEFICFFLFVIISSLYLLFNVPDVL